MIEITNRSQIAEIVREKINENNIKKTDIVKNIKMSRNTVYKVVQLGGRNEDYSVDNLLKICKELGVEIYIR